MYNAFTQAGKHELLVEEVGAHFNICLLGYSDHTTKLLGSRPVLQNSWFDITVQQ